MTDWKQAITNAVIESRMDSIRNAMANLWTGFSIGILFWIQDQLTLFGVILLAGTAVNMAVMMYCNGRVNGE